VLVPLLVALLDLLQSPRRLLLGGIGAEPLRGGAAVVGLDAVVVQAVPELAHRFSGSLRRRERSERLRGVFMVDETTLVRRDPRTPRDHVAAPSRAHAHRAAGVRRPTRTRAVHGAGGE